MGQDNKKPENVPKKCYRIGKLTRNPFLNFLREFRKQNNGTMDLIAMAKAAGCVWRNMSQTEKEPYRRQAKKVQTSLRRSAEDC